MKIETQSGHGTGFLLFYDNEKTCCYIATAEHVIAEAEEKKEPITIRRLLDNKPFTLSFDERLSFRDKGRDSAVMLLLKSNLHLPEKLISLLPESQLLRVGTQVGWLGFPSIAPNVRCFFSGHISAPIIRNQYPAYFVDGVIIHGVSGGPILHITETNEIRIAGIATEYLSDSDEATNSMLPGLAIAQSLSHFHEVLDQEPLYQEYIRKKE